MEKKKSVCGFSKLNYKRVQVKQRFFFNLHICAEFLRFPRKHQDQECFWSEENVEFVVLVHLEDDLTCSDLFREKTSGHGGETMNYNVLYLTNSAYFTSNPLKDPP